MLTVKSSSSFCSYSLFQGECKVWYEVVNQKWGFIYIILVCKCGLVRQSVLYYDYYDDEVKGKERTWWCMMWYSHKLMSFFSSLKKRR